MMMPNEIVGCNNESLEEVAAGLQRCVEQAAAEGDSLHAVEERVLGLVLELGRRSIDLFLHLQGDGDLGPVVTTADRRELRRSQQPVSRRIRTVFGIHEFSSFVYSPGPKKRIELRPIDARMSLPEGEYSYLLEEFSQYFCVEQAFGKARLSIKKVLQQDVPVDSLERICRRVSTPAEEYLDNLDAPPPQEEGEVLVATVDGKGVPMIRQGQPQAPAFGEAERRGNRQMATLACVYSVDRFVRTAEDVVAALFREKRQEEAPQRPRPCHKHVVARFAAAYEQDNETIELSGIDEAWTWASFEVEARHQPQQPLIRLCDGQESLWTSGDYWLEGRDTVDILDILHVAKYVWQAAKAFHPADQQRASLFARERLLRVLRGESPGVVRGLRQMATRQGLRGKRLQEVNKACNYMSNNAHRMRYDEYLAAGYPIASGVIEGACRHLVKDRMERSGMRWRQEGAEAILTLRALTVSELWEPFQKKRIEKEAKTLHPHRNLLRSYTPSSIAV